MPIPPGRPGCRGSGKGWGRCSSPTCRSADDGVCPQACLQRTLELHDTYGVHYTFGLPGLLGGIVNIVLMALQAQGIDESTWVTWLSPLSPHPSQEGVCRESLAGGEGHTLRARQSEGLSEYLLANLFQNSRVPTLYGLITCPGHFFLKQLA